MVVGLAAVGWFLVAPHANAQVVANHASGAYSVTATPGLGYQYRWDTNGDDKPDTKDFTGQDNVSLTLENGAERLVVLEVKNAFGQVAKRKFDLQRPKVDMTGVIDVTQGANGQLQGTPRPAQQPGRPAAPPIPPGAQLPAGHPALPQGH
jgi:hypothetical protein